MKEVRRTLLLILLPLFLLVVWNLPARSAETGAVRLFARDFTMNERLVEKHVSVSASMSLLLCDLFPKECS